ncbi:MAG: ABC transporter substrate-binding protein [SAR202 cluster bacterium]|nr:ABC transporter substrate-binding protein [SAR202 cluster bacterium]
MILNLRKKAHAIPVFTALLPLLILTLGLVLAACGGREESSTPQTAQRGIPRLSVSATAYPLEYLATRIGGDRVAVTTVVPAGAEPHDWEPSARNIEAIQKARLFLYIGADFEPWAERVREGFPANGPMAVNTAGGLAYLAEPEDEHGAEAEEADHEGELDPHVWLNPQLYARMAQSVATALSRLDPDGTATYEGNLLGLVLDLDTLDMKFTAGLASCARKQFVASHAGYGYLAERYGLEQVAITGLSPESEPSPARLREVVNEIRRLSATHVFAETLVNSAVAKTLAREVGATVLVLDPLEGLTPEGRASGQDYLSVMTQNLANLRTALGCQ